MTARRWQVHRSRFPLADLGEQLGMISAPTKQAAERIAIARYGRPVVVVLVTRPSPSSSPVLSLGEYRRRT